eukprot:CAMPEP_0184331090 /NCGR_PEP_ID=MMETSP1089-20130417/395_1 /TAXON_ID=38269 ORGANISM="Gloeochaete wittrockiana, Strain SAG46.84" /NCGR_SAMPLE_ID=MMETSP1089 /ASSEMBLY_ACC=CAM_ASM_000445 /LENGTH=67 /DNA_ID=CAMNT_0026653761 /DNA_START=28 /DNA_END=231 /DNA_ORIENTATION=+
MSTKSFHVEMTCGGCSKAVTSLVQKVPGVEEVIADHTTKRVEVRGTASTEEILVAIKKIGKPCHALD